MSHAPVEIVEEDAADLQFPKGKLMAFADIFVHFRKFQFCARTTHTHSHETTTAIFATQRELQTKKSNVPNNFF